MKAKDVVNQIKEYNSKTKLVYDKIAEKFIDTVLYELDNKYRRGTWGYLINCTQIGICIRNIDFDNSFFRIDFGWSLDKDGIGYEESFFDDCILFDDYIEKILDDNVEVLGFLGKKEITFNLKPFVDALKRKGFEIFVDEPNKGLVVVVYID